MSLMDYLEDAIQQCDAELAAMEASRQSCLNRRQHLARMVREIEGGDNTCDVSEPKDRAEISLSARPVAADHLITRERWTKAFPGFVSWSTVRRKNSNAIDEAAVTTGRGGVIFYSFVRLRAAFVAHDPTLDGLLPRSIEELVSDEAARGRT